MKAVFLDYATMGPDLSLDGLRDAVDSLTVYDNTRKSEVVERVGDAEIIFTNKNRLTPEILAQLPNLKFVGLTATGSDNVDLESAKQHGVAVANLRDYCTDSVVEHVFGTLLMLTHSLSKYAATVRSGGWQESEDPLLLVHPVTGLRGKTMGIVGFGALGIGVATKAKQFGMHTIIAARPGTDRMSEGRLPFEEVVALADVISLHCPLTDETRGLLGEREFEAMKPSAIVINTARGGLIDSVALVAALERRTIAGAAIDVLPQEPPRDGDPLLEYSGDNLIVTPHIAWASNEARQNAVDELEANTRAFIVGERRNRIA